MKLLYCIPSLCNPGGMERVLTEKVNYLSNLSDFEITVVTTDQMAKSLRFPLNDNIRVIHLDIDFNGHYSAGIFKKIKLHRKKIAIYKVKLKHIIIESNIDVCISLCGKEIDFLYKLPVRCKKIAELHFAMNYRKQFLTSNHRGFLWRILGEIRTYQLKKALKSLDKLVVLTKHDLEQWQLTHTNAIQIPNINPLFNPEKSKLISNKVVSLGRLDAQKGYDMLIDAWRLIALKCPTWILEIYGQGEWYQKLKAKINNYNLQDKIILKGIVSNVEKVYCESSIFVLSSRYEGFGMVLIEAMSCGVPVVSFECEHGPREIITDGHDGFLVEPNNIGQLADKICFLIENENSRINMGSNAIESVKRFSKGPIMQKWIELFNQINLEIDC
jgi:glycosyltransferase involved in cell wall biosynthesis